MKLINACFRTAVPKRFGCWAKFATLSVSADRTVLCIKTKQKNKRITLDTFVHCIFSVFDNMFAM